MKGIALILVFGLMIIIFIVIVPLLLLFFQTAKEEHTLLTRDIYFMENALDYGSIVADTGFSYSFFQGCWDVLRKGGFSVIPGERIYEFEGKSFALWFDNGDLTPSQEEFLGELEKEVTQNLNSYTSLSYKYIGEVNLFIPQDYNVSLEPSGFDLKGEATSPSFIAVQKEDSKRGEKIKLFKNSALKRNFTSSCLEIFEEGKKRGKEFGEAVEQIVEDILSEDTWERGGQITYGVASQQLSREFMGNAVFQIIHGKTRAEAIEEIEEAVRSQVQAIPLESEFSLSMEILELEVTISPKNCQTTFPELDNPLLAEISCSFVYQALFVGKISIEDPNTKLPVFNGEEVAFTSPELVFAERIDFLPSPGES